VGGENGVGKGQNSIVGEGEQRDEAARRPAHAQ